MAEDKPSEGSGQPWPFSPIPTIYADGIANIARGPETVRAYLMRFDPSPQGVPRPAIIGQIVLPKNGFAAMALFFKAHLDDMIAKKEISQETLDQLRTMIPADLANAGK